MGVELGGDSLFPVPFSSFRSIFPLTVAPLTVSVSLSLTPVRSFQISSAWRQRGMAPKLLGRLMGGFCQSTANKTSGTWRPLPALSPSLLSFYLFRRTQGTNKPFRLLFCSLLNVPQVANNVQLFSPWWNTARLWSRHVCQGAHGVSPGLQELAEVQPGKHRRAPGRRRTQSTANPALGKPPKTLSEQ